MSPETENRPCVSLCPPAYSYITQIRTWVFGRCVEFTLMETFVKIKETAQGVFSFLEILVSLFAV